MDVFFTFASWCRVGRQTNNNILWDATNRSFGACQVIKRPNEDIWDHGKVHDKEKQRKEELGID